MIPESPHDDTASGAELRLFECLRDQTSDELVAFHSVAWLVPSDGRPREGEADFVLAPHRKEAAQFRASLQDPQVRFESLSYPELWSEWETQENLSWLPLHVTALRERYLVAI